MIQEEKIRVIEKAVLFGTPETLDKLFDNIGAVENMSRALGLACHFRGLEWVKVLVDKGASFKKGDMQLYHVQRYDNPNGVPYYDMQEDFSVSLLDPKFRLMTMSQSWKERKGIAEDNIIAFDKKIGAVCEEERLKCVRYFIELDDNRVCDLQYLLYLAIMHCDYKVVELLREKGIQIPQTALDLLTNESKEKNNPLYFYRFNLSFITADELIWVITELSKDMEDGRFITVNAYNSVYFIEGIIHLFSDDPRVFDCVLSHFDNKTINKKRAMRLIILMEKPGLLAVCGKHGWLKMPRKRDEMIQFAADNNKTECTAWLLDFKERTTDLKAEREKAEKKLLREINADPYSVTEMKKTWGFEMREDGGIVITRYKGKRTEINVPEKIGKDIVKEIGERAFSPKAARLTSEQKNFRKAITKITLPETIEAIGNSSFYGCEKLTSVNFPNNVKEIGQLAFMRCLSLEEIRIPEGVEKIGEKAFSGCQKLRSVTLPKSVRSIETHELETIFSGCEKLTVTVPADSYAEEYCKTNNIPYIIKDAEDQK